jgi:hypothetical protein
MENGNEIAHKISSGHSTYTEAGTREKYDQKRLLEAAELDTPVAQQLGAQAA